MKLVDQNINIDDLESTNSNINTNVVSSTSNTRITDRDGNPMSLDGIQSINTGDITNQNVNFADSRLETDDDLSNNNSVTNQTITSTNMGIYGQTSEDSHTVNYGYLNYTDLGNTGFSLAIILFIVLIFFGLSKLR